MDENNMLTLREKEIKAQIVLGTFHPNTITANDFKDRILNKSTVDMMEPYFLLSNRSNAWAALQNSWYYVHMPELAVDATRLFVGIDYESKDGNTIAHTRSKVKEMEVKTSKLMRSKKWEKVKQLYESR